MPEYAPPKIHRNKTNLQLWWFTALLIAINVGLFAWQVLHGMDITSPSTADAIRWGADYAPLSYLAEPIRLFTSMFFHFGLIHLALNMWALYIFGNIAEQMLGRYYYIGLYMLAGLSGSLLSGYMAIQDSYELLQYLSNEKLLKQRDFEYKMLNNNNNNNMSLGADDFQELFGSSSSPSAIVLYVTLFKA